MKTFWFAMLGDVHLTDERGLVLLFTTHDEALMAGVRQWDLSDYEYVFAMEAVLP